MAGLADTRDFSDRYNTLLTPEQEIAFRKAYPNWQQHIRDYDLRGAYLEGLKQNGIGHFSDKYKKPNHITFSDQSIYNGMDGYRGGRWLQTGFGNYMFIPGSSNMYSPAELREYFSRAEPNSRLVDNRTFIGNTQNLIRR